MENPKFGCSKWKRQLVNGCKCQRDKNDHSPNVGQRVPPRPEVVVAPQLADAPLLGLHPGLCSRSCTGDHVVLVSRCTCRGDASARSPTRSAATTAARGRRFLLVRPADHRTRQRVCPILRRDTWLSRVSLGGVSLGDHEVITRVLERRIRCLVFPFEAISFWERTFEGKLELDETGNWLEVGGRRVCRF